jgi:hypothetical protein
MARAKKNPVEETLNTTTTTAAETASTKAKKEEVGIEIPDDSWFVKVKLTFTNDVFGLSPNNKEMYTDFLSIKADKLTKGLKNETEAARRREEVFQNMEAEMEHLVVAENLAEALDKGTTIFPKDEEGRPCFRRYQWKGYLKEKMRGAVTRRTPMISDISKWPSSIAQDVFIVDELNPIFLPEGAELSMDQRPIRFNDKMGNMVSAIASCEVVPRGSYTYVTFKVKRQGWLPVIKYLLKQGEDAGTGSRRCDGFGTFNFEVVEGDFYCPPAAWKLMIAKSKAKEA